MLCDTVPHSDQIELGAALTNLFYSLPFCFEKAAWMVQVRSLESWFILVQLRIIFRPLKSLKHHRCPKVLMETVAKSMSWTWLRSDSSFPVTRLSTIPPHGKNAHGQVPSFFSQKQQADMTLQWLWISEFHWNLKHLYHFIIYIVNKCEQHIIQQHYIFTSFHQKIMSSKNSTEVQASELARKWFSEAPKMACFQET